MFHGKGSPEMQFCSLKCIADKDRDTQPEGNHAEQKLQHILTCRPEEKKPASKPEEKTPAKKAEEKKPAGKKAANPHIFHQKVSMAQLVASDRRKIISNSASPAADPTSSPVSNPTVSPVEPPPQRSPSSVVDRSRSTLGHVTRKLKRPQPHHQ